MNIESPRQDEEIFLDRFHELYGVAEETFDRRILDRHLILLQLRTNRLILLKIISVVMRLHFS